MNSMNKPPPEVKPTKNALTEYKPWAFLEIIQYLSDIA